MGGGGLHIFGRDNRLLPWPTPKFITVQGQTAPDWGRPDQKYVRPPQGMARRPHARYDRRRTGFMSAIARAATVIF